MEWASSQIRVLNTHWSEKDISIDTNFALVHAYPYFTLFW